ncbi:PREDICTED: uncharacterized protein LOC108374579 [Rhagoletis zephyria]|uniref:uncharacterized protein LOC108356095 n=1 Tax=Rhagoletis zephyria TaxID=28612 RepID=UPI0008114D0F|nr:PREDICTED: uncharacterized protein LOC108356095 [Rhagoletis zephyria]XP_017486045.1 PREDICTED: uncharacterized protein LOC108374579 [Rhagoletis zephyria]
MKNLILLLCCSVFLHSISTSVTSAAPTLVRATPTYTVAIAPPVVTAHSHQVVARNYNRLYVPAASYVPASYVPAVSTTTAVAAAYPYAYPTTTYRYGYGYYPAYGYSYGYGSAVPTALWR